MNDSASTNFADKLNKLLIWDSESPPEETTGRIALWRSFSDSLSADIVSIPSMVEKDAEVFRQRYLSWLYNLGETKICGSRLVDHLEVRPGLSYWWILLPAEKCNYSKSSQIYDIFRLMAFESWSVKHKPLHIKIVTANPSLAECIETWCKSNGVSFDWQRLTSKQSQLSLFRRIYKFLPIKLSALIWLAKYLVTRWPLKGVGLKDWTNSKGKVAFFSYLYNLVPGAITQGKFESQYWAHLPKDLLLENCKTNWLHLYFKSSQIQTPIAAADLLRRFNSQGKCDQVHVTLDTFLSWGVVFKVLRDWHHLYSATLKLQKMPSARFGKSLEFGPLFMSAWQKSFYGAEAMSNLINLNLFEAALKALPDQRTGVYLQENQGWEASLINAWNAEENGRLIGAPNASVRFWDLRYFYDERCYVRKGRNNLPMPDLVALNGPAAMNAYLEGDYPASQMLQVEALRYLSLTDSRAAESKITLPRGSNLKVLAMGDYIPQNTQLQMQLLEQAANLLPKDTLFIIKPHPSCPVDPADYPELNMTLTTEPLSNLLATCDVAYSSSLTAASVDAYIAGIPVISVLDPSKLNMSPLRGCDGVVFVNTSQELAMALKNTKPSNPQKNSFFMLDPDLTSWKKLLIGQN